MIIENRKKSFGTLLFYILLTTVIFIIILGPVIISVTHYTFSQSSLDNFSNFLSNVFNSNSLQGFSTIFISIFLEALPFILLGSFISSLIQLFISEETLKKIIPNNMVLALISASLIGLIFPLCDCAIVPVVRRLIKKGMPLYIAITMMLSIPIINPIVLFSTYYAFSNNISVVFVRGFLGAIAAIFIGLIINFLEKDHLVVKEKENHPCHCHHQHSHSEHSHENENILLVMLDLFQHTADELNEVGRFLVLGAFLSSLMQTFIPRQYMISIGFNNIFSILAMILLAFLLAVCSETDAFIARTFLGQFTSGSIIAFLILGPMIDIKNTMMLWSSFKGKFVFKLISLIFIVCFALGIFINSIQFLWRIQ